jgi:polyhydroxybutyrate depolymerase
MNMTKLLIPLALLASLNCRKKGPAPGSAILYPEGMSTQTIKVDNVDRKFLVYRPSGITSVRSVVTVLHGGGGMGLGVADLGAHPLSVFRTVADTAKFLLVYPEGSPDIQGSPGWNDCRADDQSGSQGDDITFLQRLNARLSSELGVPSSRMFLTGTSNGALMTYAYAFRFPETIRAIAVSSGNLPLNPEPGACTTGSSLPMPLMVTHGTLDPAMPADGGCVANLGGACNRGRVVSQTATISYWLQRNQLTGIQPETSNFDFDPNDAGPVQKRVYAGAHPLVYYVLTGAGHAVPSRTVFTSTTPASGAQNRDIEFATEAWKFFRQWQ